MGGFLAGLGKKVAKHYEKKIAARATGGKKSGSGSGPSTDKAVDTLNEIVGDYHKGGMVKRTGLARVHKGERVLTKRQQKRYGMKSRSK